MLMWTYGFHLVIIVIIIVFIIWLSYGVFGCAFMAHTMLMWTLGFHLIIVFIMWLIGYTPCNVDFRVHIYFRFLLMFL